MSDPSEQAPEERAKDGATPRRPRKPTVSPPAFAGALLVLAIAGILAWLALSADKPEQNSAGGTGTTVAVTLGEEHPSAEETHSAEAEEHASDGGGEEAEEAEESAETESNEGEAHSTANATATADAHADHAAEAVNEHAGDEPGGEGAAEGGEQDASVKISLIAPRPVEEIIALAPVDPALLQETSRGALPIIGPDGREPWQVYGREVPPAGDMPRLAVIVSGLGLSVDATKRAIALPKEVSLSFTPYGPALETDVVAAREAGHEVLMDLPMEPVSYPADDPGPHTLLTSLNPSDNIARLDWLLGRFTGYVGVMNHMGSRFTASPDPLRPILHALKDRGLMFVDSRATSKSVAGGLARQMQLPHAVNDRFIDHEPTRGAIDQALAAAEGEARARGVALVVARPFPVTLERMAEWLPMLESRGIEIVPVTALANKQASR